MNNFGEKVAFIWSVADLLRGPYKPAQYGRVILPLTVLRRLDCVLEATKQKVLEKAAALKTSGIKDPEPVPCFHQVKAEARIIARLLSVRRCKCR